MNFLYQGSGSIVLFGCAGAGYSICISFRFAEGSCVYLCDKARYGILEKVCIKEVLLNGPRYIPMYLDTLNSVYAENELCNQLDAINLAKAYYEGLLGQVNQALSEQCV